MSEHNPPDMEQPRKTDTPEVSMGDTTSLSSSSVASDGRMKSKPRTHRKTTTSIIQDTQQEKQLPVLPITTPGSPSKQQSSLPIQQGQSSVQSAQSPQSKAHGTSSPLPFWENTGAPTPEFAIQNTSEADETKRKSESSSSLNPTLTTAKPISPSPSPSPPGPPKHISWMGAPAGFQEDTHNPSLPHVQEPTAPPPAASSQASPPFRQLHSPPIISTSPVPPPNSPSSTSSSPLTKKTAGKHDKRFPGYDWVQNIFSALTGILLAVSAAMIACIFLVDRVGVILEFDSDIRILPTHLLAGCIVTVTTLILGFIFGINRSKNGARAYIIILFILFCVQGYWTYRLNSHLYDHVKNMNQNWEKLPPLARSVIQFSGHCCGYKTLKDRPGDFCPKNVTSGCRFHVREIAQGLHRLMSWFLSVNGLVMLVLDLFIYFLVLYEYKPSSK